MMRGAAGTLVLRRMDRREGPKLKYFIFFVVAMYLLATVAFGVKHYSALLPQLRTYASGVRNSRL